jgi:hypothetical protein
MTDIEFVYGCLGFIAFVAVKVAILLWVFK